ncbi:hypothetical protein GCM10023165_21540 [Variovorax defluvii]|uniref:Uncharacterized protein n=2 Tax=Variovorax defluvii TaxID=913761 RepID=A0ABP8HLT5_9BURK
MPTVPDGTSLSGPASQPNASNIPDRPGQQIILINDRPPPLRSGQIIAVAQGQTHAPFEQLLCHDVGNLIIDRLVRSPVSPEARQDDKTLSEAARRCFGLTCASMALQGRMRDHPAYVASAASIRWLRNLNCLGNQLRDTWDPGALTALVHGPSDVRLQCWPLAQKARTDLLIQRLFWSTGTDKFMTMVRELFKLTKGQTLDSHHGMFIDPHYIALSALSAIIRRFGFTDNHIPPFIRQLISALDSVESLPTRLRASFWAELAIGFPTSSELQVAALKALDEMTRQDAKLEDFLPFVNQAAAFLNAPETASPELVEAVVSRLEGSDSLLWPSNVDLLEGLQRSLQPPQVEMPFENPSIRLERLLVRYMRALNAQRLHAGMSTARLDMSRIRASWLLSAFSQLEADDKLKIVDILFMPFRPNGHKAFYRDLKIVMPLIESALADHAIPLHRRLLLANDLLQRLATTQYMETGEAGILAELREVLLRELRARVRSASPGSAHHPSEDRL